MRMQSRAKFLFGSLLCLVLLAGCAGKGPVRRISDPAANLQQLTVQADGSWSVQVRIDNFSSVPMRFDRLDLSVSMAGQAATRLQASPGLSIGPESADVVTVHAVPDAGTRIAVADALARGRAIDYHLEGTLTAAPESGGAREFKVKRDNALSPAPGITGVLR
ncbi:MAG TPA: LEA type 2 family protein [Luteimonas sp.]|nr:LEA type 2 family protein [Luteimonas sp.]